MEGIAAEPRSSPLGKYVGAAIGVMTLLGLYAASRHHYLLFHSLAEIFSILIAFAMFVFAWNCRRFLEDDYLVLLGIAYLFVGGLDTLHMLAYKGMNILDEGGANRATQLWLAARYVESVSLLMAGLFVRRRIRPTAAFLAYTAACISLVLAILVWPVFPVGYVEGVGLTAFKKASEFVICGILIAALGVIFRRARAFDRTVRGLLAASIAVTVLSEVSFTLYTDVYGIFNLTGHFLKIVSFYLIYRAIIQTGLVRPLGLLFRDLKDREETQRRERALLEAVLRQMPSAVVVVEAPSGKLILANERVSEIQRSPSQEPGGLMGLSGVRLFHPDGRPCEPAQYPLSRSLRAGEVVSNEEFEIQRADGSFGAVLVSSAPIYSANGHTVAGVSTVRDITERRQMEDALRRSQQELERRVQERTAKLAQANEALHAEIAQRTRAEEGLEIAVRQWRATFDAITDPVCLLDTAGKILRANRAMVALAANPLDEVIGSTCYELIQCDGRTAGKCPVPRMMRTRRRESVLKQVSDRWFNVSVDPMIDESGQLVGAVHIIRDVTERERSHRRIQSYQQQLRSLASRLALAEERQRRHIAAELHDNVTQTLALAKIKLGAVRATLGHNEVAADLDNLRGLVDELIRYTRSLMFELSPHVLYEMGLEAALENLAENVQQRHGLHVRFQDDGQAASARVSVRREGSQIQVCVEDDGVGFDVAGTGFRVHKDGGFGLFSIRERLNQLGGRFEIWSRPGRGTRAAMMVALAT